MENKKETVPEEESPDTSVEPYEEDLLYKYNLKSQDGGMRWNNTLCRKPGR